MGAGGRTVAAGLLAAALLAAVPSSRVGVEMPLAGDDGARGLAAMTAIRLVLGDRAELRAGARVRTQNPHQDEGSDNDLDVASAPAIVASLAADPRVAAGIGGLRRNVGDADARAADALGLPFVVLARWSRTGRPGAAFCLCVAPPRLVAFARAAARRRFGAGLRVVLVGAAATLPREWPAAFVRTGHDGDAVLVIADEHPPALWRATAFARAADRGYLRGLGHRGSRLVPFGVRPGEVLVIRQRLPDGPARRAFARRYHDAAGFIPDDDLLRAYAAAQVVAAAGTTRAQVRAALPARRFATAAGAVAFDADGYWANAVLDAEPG